MIQASNLLLIGSLPNSSRLSTQLTEKLWFPSSSPTRTQADEVWGGPDASAPPAQQHAAQKLRLAAGEETSAGEGVEATGGKHPGRNSEEAAGEEGRGEPPRGHQGKSAAMSHAHTDDIKSQKTLHV